MPAAGIHLCIAKKLLNEKLDKERFYVGNIAPDSWRNSNSNKHEYDKPQSLVITAFLASQHLLYTYYITTHYNIHYIMLKI